MIRCFDIACIVMRYLNPTHLDSFFVQCGFDFRNKFVYDARDWIFESNKLDNVNMFSNFCNIVLTGITFKIFDVNDINNIGFCLNNLSYIGLYSSSQLINIQKKILTKLWNNNIKILKITNCHSKSIAQIAELCGGIKSLILDRKKYGDSPYLTGLSHYGKLKKLQIKDCMYINDNDIQELSACNSLTHLKLHVKLSICIGSGLNCKKLRLIKFKYCNIQTLDLLEGCSSLEYVLLEKCNNLRNICGLLYCPKLKKIIIRECKSLKDGINFIAENWEIWKDLKIILS